MRQLIKARREITLTRHAILPYRPIMGDFVLAAGRDYSDHGLTVMRQPSAYSPCHDRGRRRSMNGGRHKLYGDVRGGRMELKNDALMYLNAVNVLL